MIIWLFILLMWFTKFIDLWILNHSCISGINPTWTWFWSFCCRIGFVLLIFWEALHLNLENFYFQVGIHLLYLSLLKMLVFIFFSFTVSISLLIIGLFRFYSSCCCVLVSFAQYCGSTWVYLCFMSVLSIDDGRY